MTKRALWTSLCLLCGPQSNTEIITFQVLFRFQDTTMGSFSLIRPTSLDVSRTVIMRMGKTGLG